MSRPTENRPIMPQRIPFLKRGQKPTFLSAAFANLVISALNWCTGLRVGNGLRLKTSETGPFIELEGASDSDQRNNESPIIKWCGEYKDDGVYPIGGVVIVGSHNFISEDESGNVTYEEGYDAILEDGCEAGTYIKIRPCPVGTTPWGNSKFWATFSRAQWEILCRRKSDSATDRIIEWVNQADIRYKQTRGTHNLQFSVDDARDDDLSLNLEITLRRYKYTIQVDGACKTLYFMALGSLPYDPATGAFYDPITGTETTQ